MSTQETELDVNSVSNENLTATVTRYPHCRVKLDISVQPNAVKAAYQKAIKNVSKHVTVPGFRKGKAPESFILKEFQSDIRKEWFDLVIQTALNEAIPLAQLHPLQDGYVGRPNMHECSLENGARFTVDFETRPVIPAIQVEDLKITKIDPKPVTEEQKEAALHRVLSQFIEYKPVEDRAAQEKDFVDLDIDFIEGEPRRVVNNQRVEISSQGLPTWIRDKIIGLKAGENAEGHTQQEQSSDQEFKSVPFRVTVRNIWTGHFPPLDDELAKKLGLETVQELKDKIQQRLELEAQEDASQQEMHQLETLLLEKYPIDLPLSMIEKDKQSRLERYIKELTVENQEDYFRTHRHRIEQMIDKAAKEGLQLFFLLNRVAQQYHIEASDLDITQELSRQISLMAIGQNDIDLYSNRDEIRRQVNAIAMDRKVKQFLIDKATQHT